VSYTEAAVTALQAGCDLVLLCNQSTPDSPQGGQAVDELLDGLSHAQNHASKHAKWQASAVSEQRRLALLPTSKALDWDTLMQNTSYLQALSFLP
jgi:beta-N-acetylhexosaminidase